MYESSNDNTTALDDPLEKASICSSSSGTETLTDSSQEGQQVVVSTDIRRFIRTK